jgi:hypothetical protein
MASSARLDNSRIVTSSSGTESHSPVAIMRVPSSMNARPRPSVMPRVIGRATHFATLSAAPVNPSASQMSPVASAATATASGVTTAVCAAPVTATAPMAFIGCTGNGVRKYSPAATSATPNASSIPAGWTPTTVT